MPCPAVPRGVLPERSAPVTKLLAAPLVCHTWGKNSLLRDQMRIHMYMRKPVLAAGQSDFPCFDDDRDCQREQPAAVSPVVVYSCPLQPARSGVPTTAPLANGISARERVTVHSVVRSG